MKTEKVQLVYDRITAAVEGGTSVEIIKEDSVFICGPNSHNNIPGAFRSSRSGVVHPYHECAVRDNRRGWIPRLRAELKKLGIEDAKVVVEYDSFGCWVQGYVDKPTGTVTITHKSFDDGWGSSLLIMRLPIAAKKSQAIQATLPNGWLAK